MRLRAISTLSPEYAPSRRRGGHQTCDLWKNPRRLYASVLTPTHHSLDPNSPSRRPVRSHGRTPTTPNQDPDKKTRKPKHSGQKGKSLRRVPLPTVVVRQIDTSPLPDAAALDRVVVVVLQQPKDRKPRAAEQQIRANVHERGVRQSDPEECEPDRECRDDGAVDEPCKGADAVRVVLVQEVGAQAEDDGCGDELRQAQHDGEDA